MAKPQIKVGISARHLHVTKEHLEILFGKGHELHAVKPLGQPGQFASEERVDLVTEKGTFKQVRILGPIRSATQVELSLTDAMKLGLKVPVRDSGDHHGSPGMTLIGPKGEVKIDTGVIAACRHIHMTPADAAQFGVKDKQFVSVKIGNADRHLIFEQVLIRVRDDFALEMHVDTDEGNAAGTKSGDFAVIVE